MIFGLPLEREVLKALAASAPSEAAVTPRMVRRRTAVVENWQIPPVRLQP
jgi:hypothetical protein